MKANKVDVESYTSELFPKIHLRATHKELETCRRNVRWLLGKYTKTQIQILDILKDKEILEVGCGGRASGIYALEVYHPKSITGVDLSPQNVKKTREMCETLEFNNVRVENGNALNLNFEKSSFDFVFSDGVIHHTIDPYRCFLEMVRVLKPNGYLLLGIYGYGGIWGKVIHPLGMLMGKIIPIKFTEKFVNLTGFMRSQEHSLLDWFYTPIQEKYKLTQILNWFSNNDFDQIVSLGSPKWYYQMGGGLLTRFLFGDGYIYMMGRKKNALDARTQTTEKS